MNYLDYTSFYNETFYVKSRNGIEMIRDTTEKSPQLAVGFFHNKLFNVSSHSAISDVHGVRGLFQIDSFQLLFPDKCPAQE